MIGFISHRKPRAQPPANQEPDVTMPPVIVAAPEPELDWKDISDLLSQKLTSQAFDKTLR